MKKENNRVGTDTIEHLVNLQFFIFFFESHCICPFSLCVQDDPVCIYGIYVQQHKIREDGVEFFTNILNSPENCV